MRGPRFPKFLLILASLWLLPAAPAGAADSHAPAPEQGTPIARDEPADVLEPADASAADPAQSPWEHPLWHNATTLMRLYVCDYARRPPSWCGETRDLPAKAALPDPQGPPLTPEDAVWLAFIESADPANLTAEQIALVRRRAVERRDPQAMEILGYLYAEGHGVERDYVEAYRWYGMAYLAGERRVRDNMDIVWQQVQRHDLEGALVLTREFDALAQGEVPDSLRPPPESPAAAGAGAVDNAAGAGPAAAPH